MRLVKGRFPVATPAPSPTSTGMPVVVQPGAKPIIVNPSTGKPIAGQPGDGTAPAQAAEAIQVVMSKQTAATFGLHVGSKFEMIGPERASTGQVAKVNILVTGHRGPGRPGLDLLGRRPRHRRPRPPRARPTPVLGGRGHGRRRARRSELEQYFSSASIQLEWVFPLSVGSLTGQQVQPLSQRARLAHHPGADADRRRRAGRPLADRLLEPAVGAQQFIATAQSVDTLLWLLYVSLTMTGLAVLLLAGRMVAMRRRAELAVIRARGASLRQIALGTAAGAALVCVPAAVLGGVLAILAVPGPARCRPPGGGRLVAADRRAGRGRLRSRPDRRLAAPPAQAPAAPTGARPRARGRLIVELS